MGYYIITGASGGIGQVTSQILADAGYDLILTDITDPADLASSLNSKSQVYSFPLNVSKKTSVEQLFNSIKSQNLEISGLVNLAGITLDKTLLNMTEEQWDQVISVNLKGAFLMTKYSAKLIMEKGGSMILIGSTSAHHGNFGQANYAASKMALEAFARSTARELAKYNIRVNCIVPGYIETPMTDKIPDQHRQQTINSIPLGRIGNPLDVANVIEFLLSDKSSFITGSAIRVDGGMRM